ncbi:uncharacterized protein LOC116421732 [Sarcophilus harrisii]|uniref:Glycosyltransferase family 92 protein n=1 Tax=Sarcophilus harrisii TaxID=9305 RepID=G3WXC5_SARHA|nr:uncharacterized protein LOC116421732 [Sarcophilus harrisii]
MPTIYFLRTFFVVMVFASILWLLSFYWLKFMENEPRRRKVSLALCRGQIARGSITPLENTRTFIIAPYFDRRFRNLTRVISIIHHKDVKELYCWFCCQSSGNISVIRAGIDVLGDRFGFPYSAANLLCEIPQNCNAQYMSIHWAKQGNFNQMPWFEIRNQETWNPSSEFTVCISPLFGNYNNVLQFIQSIEMYKILGVQEIMIYKTNCSQLLEKVLAYYINEGTVQTISWPITSFLNVSPASHFSKMKGDIGYYGQLTALNDCLYRNMLKSKFVLLNDIDEILLPKDFLNWTTMLRKIKASSPHAGIFLFENFVFPTSIFTSNSKYNISSWRVYPGVNILQHVYREVYQPWKYKPKKMMVSPFNVIQISVHRVLRGFGPQFHVSPDLAFFYHCRYVHPRDISQKLLVRDHTIWQFGPSLVKKVNQVVQKLFPQNGI